MKTDQPALPTDRAAVPRADLLRSPRVLVPLALLALYLIWGSTYLAISVALRSYPPFLMAGLRFVCAGAALYGFLRWRGLPAPTRAQWVNATATGTLLLGLGNGLVCFAEQTVPSGLAAVAVAAMPLFAAIFGGLYGQWPRRIEWLGLAIGFGGVVLLNLGGALGAAPLGAIALVTAAMAWAFGSVWSKRRDMPPAAMNTAAQMLAGGAVLLIVAVLAGERAPRPDVPSAALLASTLAVAYLAVMGSIVAFSAYLYLLNTVRPALATSYAYVNPPVAVLFGVLLGNERVTPLDLIAMGVILAGVALITLVRGRTTGAR